MKLIANVERLKRNRNHHDRRIKNRLLPHIEAARSLGRRRLDDILSFVKPRYLNDRPGKPLMHTTLYRAISRLHELGLDPGLDDLSTARKLGRTTRGKQHAKQDHSGAGEKTET